MMRVLQSDVHVEGSFAGLGDDGALHLRHSNGERHVVTTGDVELMG